MDRVPWPRRGPVFVNSNRSVLGPVGTGTSEVTVWRSADRNDDTVKAYLAGMLGDLVPESGIVIAGTVTNRA